MVRTEVTNQLIFKKNVKKNYSGLVLSKLLRLNIYFRIFLFSSKFDWTYENSYYWQPLVFQYYNWQDKGWKVFPIHRKQTSLLGKLPNRKFVLLFDNFIPDFGFVYWPENDLCYGCYLSSCLFFSFIDNPQFHSYRRHTSDRDEEIYKLTQSMGTQQQPFTTIQDKTCRGICGVGGRVLGVSRFSLFISVFHDSVERWSLFTIT